MHLNLCVWNCASCFKDSFWNCVSTLSFAHKNKKITVVKTCRFCSLKTFKRENPKFHIHFSRLKIKFSPLPIVGFCLSCLLTLQSDLHAGIIMPQEYSQFAQRVTMRRLAARGVLCKIKQALFDGSYTYMLLVAITLQVAERVAHRMRPRELELRHQKPMPACKRNQIRAFSQPSH